MSLESASNYLSEGQKLSQEGKLQDAINAYFKAIELAPDFFDAYHQLGECLARLNQQPYWESAITLYQRIREQQPGLLWPHHFLGDAFRHQKHWENAISAYGYATEIDPNFFWSFNFLGDCLRQTQQWNDATIAYQEAIRINPNYIWSYHFLGETFKNMQKWFESIAPYQKALELDPKCNYTRKSLADVYIYLGKVLVEQDNLDSALEFYNNAVELLHSQIYAYSELRQLITRGYYELGLKIGQRGDLDKAIKIFQQVPNRSYQWDSYDYLWRSLNTNLVYLIDDNIKDSKLEIIEQEAVDYFSKTCQYKIINLYSLTESDLLLIHQSGLSLANLELMRQDNVNLEEIYINSFDEEDKTGTIKLSRKVKREFRYSSSFFSNTLSQGMSLQQTIVETEYVYTICPFTGKIVRSNQSIWLTRAFVFYRFVSTEVFYLLVGDCATRLCVYFPQSEIICPFFADFTCYDYAQIINQFKGRCVKDHKNMMTYLSNPEKKEVVSVLGVTANIFHYVWNELSGIEYLYDNGLLNKIDKFLVTPFEFWNLEEVFPEVDKNKIIRLPDSDRSINETIIKNNYFAVMICGFWVQEKLISRIYNASLKKCSQDFFQKLEKAQKNFPLLWITIRSRRVWFSQVEGIANIIKSLASDFPNLAVVFDGWSRTERKSDEEDRIDMETKIMKNILALIPENINTYSIIGSMTYEKVIWAHAIDLCIAPIGAGLTFTSWIANKTCVVHGHSGFGNTQYIDTTYSSLTRENCVKPILVAGVDLDESGWYTRNYDCDWIDIYNEVVKILKNINPQR